MVAPASPFDVGTFLAELRAVGCGLGEPFHYFSSTTSTNDEAKLAADGGAPEGTTFFSDYQTAGRGRRGKAWFAHANGQILASVLLRSKHSSNNAALTLAVGAALHRALSGRLPDTAKLSVKWPNDIESDGRKLAGVLTESWIAHDNSQIVVVGFGVNVEQPSLPADDPTNPIGLRALGCAETRETLLVHILRSLEDTLRTFRDQGLPPFVSYLNRHNALSQSVVSVNGRTGQVNGITAEGALLLTTAAGTQTITSGTVERVRG